MLTEIIDKCHDTTGVDAYPKYYYVAVSPGATVFKCAGKCPDAGHEHYYTQLFGHYGAFAKQPMTYGLLDAMRDTPAKYRVVLMDQYLGDRITRAGGRWSRANNEKFAAAY